VYRSRKPCASACAICKSFKSEGTLQINIFGDGGWLLEVLDEFGNSTAWDDSFFSDQAALDEALETICKEGIENLIGIPSQSANQ
jgi:hypothetical protein